MILLSCAAIEELAKVQKPQVAIDKVRFTGMTFETLSLAFDVKIDNPNPLSATLAGFDYDFMINGASFLSGQQVSEMVIESMGQSMVEIPLTLKFEDLYKTYQTIVNQDSTRYTLATGLSFNLPVLGNTRLPLSHQGSLPLIKLPDIKIGSLDLKKLSLTGAEMALKLDVSNPNAFNVILNKLNYGLKINGQSWAQGVTSQAMTVNEKGNGTLTIPISLNFLQMGRTVYGIVSGNEKLNYSFDGNVDLGSSLPLLNQMNLPINKSGAIKISK
jgi:LEA14-like dessication related protein